MYHVLVRIMNCDRVHNLFCTILSHIQMTNKYKFQYHHPSFNVHCTELYWY